MPLISDANAMAYSLWRNNECLGTIVADFPSDSAVVFGLFIPTARFTDIGRLLQTRHPFARRPVFLSRFDSSHGPGPIELQPLPPDQADGLPPAAQFVLRNSDNVIDVDMISLSSVTISGGAGPLADLYRAHGYHELAWILSAHRDAESGPREV